MAGSHPRRAHVVVDYEADTLVIEVLDEGQKWPAPLDRGRGIAGMRERVALYGGELTVGPRPSGSFAVHARFPVHEP